MGIAKKDILQGKMNTYESIEFKGPFLDYKKHENDEELTIEFDRSYAEDSKFEDKTYIRLVIEALEEINNNTEPNKRILLKAWGKEIQIPRGLDAFELQDFISKFVIENADLSSKSFEDYSSDSNYGIKTQKKMFNMSDSEACISYIERDFETTTNIKFGNKYSRDNNTTYMQMAVEALSDIDKKTDLSKRINVTIWERTLEIPRDADKYEIQELLTNFVLKNATFYSGEGREIKEPKERAD